MSRQDALSLEHIILDASETNDWKVAVKEWEIIGMWDDSSRSQCCICGQDSLRYLFAIRNNVNGRIIYPIGSTCIQKFNRSELDWDAKVRMQATHLMDAAIELGKGKRVSIKSGYFTGDLLLYMHHEGAFRTNRGPSTNDAKQWSVLDGILCKRKPTYEELQEADSIIDHCVYPWLRNLYRSTRTNAPNSWETSPN